MSRLLGTVWTVVERDPVIALTILVSFVLGALNIFGLADWLSTDVLSGLILLILALFAYGLLQVLYELRGSPSGHGAISESFVSAQTPPSFEDDLEDAREVWLLGVSLASLLENYEAVFEAKLRRRHRLNVLFVEPDHAACELVSLRDQTLVGDQRDTAAAYQRARIRSALEIFSGWKKTFPKQVEIKTSQYPMDFELILASIGSRRVIYMRHYPFKTSLGGELRIVIPGHDRGRFAYYESHIRNLWRHGYTYCDSDLAKNEADNNVIEEGSRV